VWRAIAAHDAQAPARMAADDLRFTFVGDTPLGAELTGREPFRAWLEGVFARFPDISFAVRDVAVHGGPWRTCVAVRLDVTATLADGTSYTNRACQWITLRWGRMTEDWVLEDTQALAAACASQAAAAVSRG
jgi:ketosteroid isomerase-like protein